MKVTDYSRISHRYEKNQYRLEIKPDRDLKLYFDESQKDGYNVLDLACGTGIYLHNQVGYFAERPVAWHGLDASEEMLRKAKEKLPLVSFVEARAENMPYLNDTFDYIVSNYAFHHFTGKSEALDEVKRVLKTGGIFKIHNIAIHEMPRWWVYQYFPSAYFEDLKRFWSKDLLFNELSMRGFDVNVRIEYRMESTRVTDFLHYAENRDISVLTLVDNAHFSEGLDKMKYEVSKNPEAEITNDFADIFVVAKKR